MELIQIANHYPALSWQKHAECSEEFFKDSVMDVVSHQRATEDEKRELLKLIKRMNDAENGDSGTYARACTKRAFACLEPGSEPASSSHQKYQYFKDIWFRLSDNKTHLVGIVESLNIKTVNGTNGDIGIFFKEVISLTSVLEPGSVTNERFISAI
jgi:hypothetical protein